MRSSSSFSLLDCILICGNFTFSVLYFVLKFTFIFKNIIMVFIVKLSINNLYCETNLKFNIQILDLKNTTNNQNTE